MRSGRASRTAEQVCIGRAIADGVTLPERFHDPTALALLSERGRARVAQARAQLEPSGLRARAMRGYLRIHSLAMVARTVAIDDAIREAAAPQLVILGAGLDGRAYRMPELHGAIVFEVDHRDSQHEKRARLRSAGLAPTAHDVRFVEVDFARDDLDGALARAGHDRALPTTWVWEGVVMYLSRAEVDATLSAIAKRSAPGSRLIVLYHSPALVLRAVGLVLRVLGEPLRSAHTADAMRALLGKHGFAVARDADLPAIAASLSGELTQPTRALRHMRLAIADHAVAT